MNKFLKKFIDKKKLKHVSEYLITRFLFGTLKRLPLPVGSHFGAAVGAFFATLPTKVNETARTNLRTAYPALDEDEARQLQFAAAVSLGRTFFEMPRLYKLSKAEFNRYVDLEGLRNLTNHPDGLILSAHLGNWEFIPKLFGLMGLPLGSIYRKASNPLTDTLITELRKQPQGVQIPKGTEGGRQILKLVKEGKHLGLLNDQKLNDGIEAPFFGHKVMTAPSLAELALKYKRPVLPVFCTRESVWPLKFKLTIGAPLTLKKDAKATTALFNEVLEEQITNHADQWMWFHKRF